MQDRYGDSFTAFLRNGPQTHLRTDLTQDGNLVTQATIRIRERARQTIGGDQTIGIRHKRRIALREDRFKPVTNHKIEFQQIMQLARGQRWSGPSGHGSRRGGSRLGGTPVPQRRNRINMLRRGRTDTALHIK